MKKRILIITVILTVISCKAQQIIPIEDHRRYLDEGIEFPEGGYIKDIHHLLDKYVGKWKGTYIENNYTYEFEIKKRLYISKTRDLKIDELIMRYRITNNNGKEVFSTLSLSNKSPYVIQGRYLYNWKNKTYYVLGYVGKEAECGQEGNIFIRMVDKNKMELYLSTDIDMYSCETEQILPTKRITLTKQ